MLDSVIVAAGRSRRMGFDKLMVPVRGRSVLERSVRAMAGCPEVGRIVVVCPPGREEEIRGQIGRIDKVAAVVAGADERSGSVAAGAGQLGGPSSDRWVAVHDAARPLVRPEAVSRCFHAARLVGAAALAARVADTLHRTGEDGILRETVSRECLWQVQTPQIVRSDWLEQALTIPGATDEAGSLAVLGFPVRMVENPFPNPKLTVPSDVAWVEALAATLPEESFS